MNTTLKEGDKSPPVVPDDLTGPHVVYFTGTIVNYLDNF